jgi:hypothetical protein
MKRRLQLMPEVLPAPNRTATSAVRERTMARLRVLAAVGAGIAAACGGATRTGSETGDGNGNGGGPDGGLPDGNRPDSDPGYGVVDPLPAPACFDYATPPTATAKFVNAEDVGLDPTKASDSGAGRYVQVLVTLNQKDVAVGEIQNSGTSGITILRKDLKAGEIEVILYEELGPDEFNTTLQIQTSCAKGPPRVFVSLQHAAGGGGNITTSVSFSGG